ncbi:MAG: hypothetical protein L3K00_03075 [Thermoplasmata archaeon]|nr:hypothetical protein [Thermoplasmata archaeon]
MRDRPDYTSRARGEWTVEEGETPDDPYVLWRFERGGNGSDEDQYLHVYLPRGKAVRNLAAVVIAEALNAARIPGPIRRRKKP